MSDIGNGAEPDVGGQVGSVARAAQALQQNASEPNRSVWVAASAGSGKTKVLTDRVLRLLLSGARPERILCLTFTKAAAAEMATRIAGRLSAWSVVDDATLDDQLRDLSGRAPEAIEVERARRLFATVLDAPGGLEVQTIHGFCQSILRRFPLEAGLPPQFDVLDERTAAERMRMARDLMILGARRGAAPG
ncbi:MAG: UvrD-helicase domain-containing protein, partial [Proteobacteria bacterium]|nr:UvrD-helicase domain-containing protein [Pseudomonadota bacterium]